MGADGDTVEVRLRAADDTWRSVELTVQLVEMTGRAALLVIGRDITERKRLQGQVLVADRMFSLGTLATGIAHEINNPLACVMGNLAVVSDALAQEGLAIEGEERAELREALRDAYEGAERVRKIVLGLRSFSRTDAERASVDVNQIVERAIALTGNELRHRAVVREELATVGLVLGDESRLTQVVIALLVNAAQAIPAGKADTNTVTVRTRQERDHVILEVQDTGAGIPASVLPRVFDPFFTTKPVGGGAGLGLSICHGIVTGLGGQIALESQEGHGVLVRVSLPLAQPAAQVGQGASAATGVAAQGGGGDCADSAQPRSLVQAVAQPASSPSAPAASDPAAPVPRAAPPAQGSSPVSLQQAPHRSVLIVDDDPMVGQVLRRMLDRQESATEVTVVTSVAEALSALRGGRRYDAIVSDVMMPNQSGLELYDLVRSFD
ncbi:MAG TPA: ATP-binding protein, partial [Kofleriaceae bacterium]|nr:ATP-binding protein [Kofleriaceae bacterium]